MPPTPVDYSPVIVDNEFPMGTISFDLETGSVKDMWTCGQEFVRLSGHCIDGGDIQNYPSPAAVIEDILGFDGWIISHNGMNFDSVLLDRLYGVSILHLAKRDRLIDTKLLAFLADPPGSQMAKGEIEKRYSLQTVGTKYLGEGKMVDVVTGGSVLKELAKEFGGFDRIPQDNLRYNDYLKRDVEATRDLARVLPMSDYTRREHRIAAVCATISIQGFRVNIPLLEERIKEGEDKRARILGELSSYGLPSPESTKAPQRTTAGINAINTAFVNLGVTLPRSEKTNRPMMGKDVLQGVIDSAISEEAGDLAEAIMGLNGIRCVPMDSEILTPSGWKTVDNIVLGDETLGLGEDGFMHWTPVTAINKYEEAPLLRISNNHFSVVCSPNHRWVTDHRYNSSYWTKENPGTSTRKRELRESVDLGAYDRLVVAARAMTPHSLPITKDESEIIGWVLGDGHTKWHPFTGSPKQGIEGEKCYFRFSIGQKKPVGVEALRSLLSASGLMWTENFTAGNQYYTFTLQPSDARDLWKRAGFSHHQDKYSADLTAFVLALGSEQRRAFIHGFWGAEGHIVGGKNRVVTQMPGPVAEAVRLAVFLDGHRATRPNKSAGGCDTIRCDAPPSVTGECLSKTPLPSAPVWCPTTELGTWVMRQGDQICLTGNSIYANVYDNLVGDRVHPNINLRQSTGRLSITDPGLTVIGKREGKVKERAVFLPDEGCILISADLAQVDARAVAGLSQDTEYLKLFEDGRDLHAEMAERLFGTKSKREAAKAAAHGINYGMRPRKLAFTTGMDLYEAETVILNFEKSFPILTRWQNKVREEGQTTGILYNGYGRLMRIEPERAFTQSPALMGQSTARDILMEGVLRLWDTGGERVIQMIRGVIHDELVLSVPVAEVEEVEQLVVEAMSFPWCPVGGTYAVQILAGLNQRGSSWEGCYIKGA